MQSLGVIKECVGIMNHQNIIWEEKEKNDGIQDSLSMCLKHKRVAEREQSNASYKCIKSKAELETNIDGSLSIKKLILQ